MEPHNATLLCSMGDLTKQTVWYERAWDASSHKQGRRCALLVPQWAHRFVCSAFVFRQQIDRPRAGAEGMLTAGTQLLAVPL